MTAAPAVPPTARGRRCCLATFALSAAGSYGYVYRFSLDYGISWTVCDLAAGDFGAGSNPNLTFDLSEIGPLTSTP